MADWVGIAETTIRDYIRDVEDDVMRNRKILALLQSRGRVTFNHSGTEMDWKIRYKRAVPKGYADMDQQSFSRRNRHKTAVLGYRGYSLAESISKLDKLKNRGVPAIVKILETKVTSMAEDFEEFMGDEFYVDGNSTGNGKRIHGIESFMGQTTTSTVSPIANPSDSYAGLNTDLGSYGGSWSKDGSNNVLWPTGTGNSEYDFYSPLLVDYTSTNTWSAATKTWPNTCVEAMRYGIIKSMKNKSARGRLDAIFLNDEMYRQFVENLAAKEHITVVQGGGQKGTTLTGLGYTDVTNFEGCEVTYEYGMPVNTGYGWNIDQMEFRSMQDRLIVTEGPFEHEADKTVRFSLDFFGNLVFRPRYFVKFKNYT